MLRRAGLAEPGWSEYSRAGRDCKVLGRPPQSELDEVCLEGVRLVQARRSALCNACVCACACVRVCVCVCLRACACV